MYQKQAVVLCLKRVIIVKFNQFSQNKSSKHLQ